MAANTKPDVINTDDDEQQNPDDAKVVRTREQIKASELPPNERTQIMFSLPAGLRAIAEKSAEDKDVGLGTIIREAVADYFDYELPAAERRKRASKYANDDERKAAQAEKNKKRNNTLKKLLALYNSGALGELDLDDDDDDSEDDDD